MYTQIYTDIVTKINAITPAVNIKWFDLWNEQPKNWDKEQPFPRPAVFVEFTPVTDWEMCVLGVKKGTLQIRLHIITDKVAETYFTPAGAAANQTAGLKGIQLLENIKGNLSLMQSSGFYTPLRDTGDELDTSNDLMKDDMINLKTQVKVKKATNQPVGVNGLYQILNPSHPTPGGSPNEVIKTVKPIFDAEI